MFDRKIDGMILVLLIFVIPTCMVMSFYTLLFGFSQSLHIFRDEWPFIVIQIVFCAIPFVVTALSGANRVGVWLSITVISGIIWAWFGNSVIQSAEAGSGVNFGAIFVMLGAPIAISIVVVVFDRITK